MTVADLIRELQRLRSQHVQVRAVTGTVVLGGDHEPYEAPLSNEDATEAEDVRHMGPWVLIRRR